MKRYLLPAAVVAATWMLCGTGRAATFTEIGDAGELPGAAQYTGAVGPLEYIQGTMLNFPGIRDIDVFAIDIFDPNSFFASTVNSNTVGVAPEFDTQLFLFDRNGNGVVANDDAPADLRSTIPAGSLMGRAADLYFLAIAEIGDTPIDDMGNPLFDFDGSAVSGVGPLAGWLSDLNATAASGGLYQIDLAGARGAEISQVVPEPATLAMFSVLLSLVAVRTRFRPRPGLRSR